MKARYHIIVWHGKCGSIGQVIDRKTGRTKGMTSTFRDKAGWRNYVNQYRLISTMSTIFG